MLQAGHGRHQPFLMSLVMAGRESRVMVGHEIKG